MKRTLLSVILLFTLTNGGAAQAADFRLGYVDFQRALNSVEEGKVAKANLEREFESKRKEIESKKTKLDGLQTQIQDLQKKAQSGLLKDSDKQKGMKLEQDFQKDFKITVNWRNSIRGYFRKEAKLTGEILRKLRAVVEDLGREGMYTMVVEKNESGLIYASEATDLTEKLIQRYNGKYKAKKK